MQSLGVFLPFATERRTLGTGVRTEIRRKFLRHVVRDLVQRSYAFHRLRIVFIRRPVLLFRDRAERIRLIRFHFATRLFVGKRREVEYRSRFFPFVYLICAHFRHFENAFRKTFLCFFFFSFLRSVLLGFRGIVLPDFILHDVFKRRRIAVQYVGNDRINATVNRLIAYKAHVRFIRVYVHVHDFGRHGDMQYAERILPLHQIACIRPRDRGGNRIVQNVSAV